MSIFTRLKGFFSAKPKFNSFVHVGSSVTYTTGTNPSQGKFLFGLVKEHDFKVKNNPNNATKNLTVSSSVYGEHKFDVPKIGHLLLGAKTSVTTDSQIIGGVQVGYRVGKMLDSIFVGLDANYIAIKRPTTEKFKLENFGPGKQNTIISEELSTFTKEVKKHPAVLEVLKSFTMEDDTFFVNKDVDLKPLIELKKEELSALGLSKGGTLTISTSSVSSKEQAKNSYSNNPNFRKITNPVVLQVRGENQEKVWKDNPSLLLKSLEQGEKKMKDKFPQFQQLSNNKVFSQLDQQDKVDLLGLMAQRDGSKDSDFGLEEAKNHYLPLFQKVNLRKQLNIDFLNSLPPRDINDKKQAEEIEDQEQEEEIENQDLDTLMSELKATEREIKRAFNEVAAKDKKSYNKPVVAVLVEGEQGINFDCIELNQDFDRTKAILQMSRYLSREDETLLQHGSKDITTLLNESISQSNDLDYRSKAADCQLNQIFKILSLNISSVILLPYKIGNKKIKFFLSLNSRGEVSVTPLVEVAQYRF